LGDGSLFVLEDWGRADVRFAAFGGLVTGVWIVSGWEWCG
jgi:hypothetical protein